MVPGGSAAHDLISDGRYRMLYVVLCKARPGTRKERLARRLEWKPPEGATVVAEYWLLCDDPAVIDIVEADSLAPIMAGMQEWDDVFEMTVIPAVTAEAGIEAAQQAAAQG
jgi:hypothetical protein